MPIKGWSDEVRLPRVGKIHLGIKKISEKTGREYPEKADHFVVKADETTPEDAAQAFKAVYGHAPKKLDVLFPVDDEAIVFPQWFKLYGQGTGLKRKCDGETCIAWDESAGQMVESPCLCAKEDESGVAGPRCNEVASLSVILPRVRGLGVWQIDTGSRNSIINVNSFLRMVRAAYGKITGVPMTLSLIEQDVQRKGQDGRLQKTTVYVLRLDCNAMFPAALPAEEPKAIEAPKEPHPAERFAPKGVDAPAPHAVKEQIMTMYRKIFPEGDFLKTLGSHGFESVDDMSLKQANEFLNWMMKEDKIAKSRR